MRILLDTCVLVDYFSRREPYFHDSLKLRIMQASGDIELWVSAKSFTDIFYILKKAIDPKLLQDAFMASLSFLKICSIGGDDIRAAAEASWPDFEDCLIAACAQKVKADYLITRDTQGFKLAKTSVATPKDFLQQMQEENGWVYEDIYL